MLDYVDRACNFVMHYANNLSPREWLVVLALVVPLGLICLRGFGSRSSY